MLQLNNYFWLFNVKQIFHLFMMSQFVRLLENHFTYPQNTVEFILNDLKKEGYSYKNINSTITITRSSSIQQTIHGVVKDPDGIPLPGATVMLKGDFSGDRPLILMESLN